jgi:hypothetical protein
MNQVPTDGIMQARSLRNRRSNNQAGSGQAQGANSNSGNDNNIIMSVDQDQSQNQNQNVDQDHQANSSMINHRASQPSMSGFCREDSQERLAEMAAVASRSMEMCSVPGKKTTRMLGE